MPASTGRRVFPQHLGWMCGIFVMSALYSTVIPFVLSQPIPHGQCYSRSPENYPKSACATVGYSEGRPPYSVVHSASQEEIQSLTTALSEQAPTSNAAAEVTYRTTIRDLHTVFPTNSPPANILTANGSFLANSTPFALSVTNVVLMGLNALTLSAIFVVAVFMCKRRDQAQFSCTSPSTNPVAYDHNTNYENNTFQMKDSPFTLATGEDTSPASGPSSPVVGSPRFPRREASEQDTFHPIKAKELRGKLSSGPLSMGSFHLPISPCSCVSTFAATS